MENEIQEILSKNSYDIYDLIKIVKILRSENGCPWDKVQTHKSIRNDFLEEVYEVIEGIDMDNSEMLREELGDVLLQVIFHTQIETESNNFNFNDVTNDICKKLIVRHPHVFGDVNANNVDTVLQNWDAIKKETKGQQSYTDTLKSVPKVFPALMRAQKLGKRASRAGMDFEGTDDCFESLKSEVAELEEALKANNQNDAEEELGDLLFSCANMARKLGADAEQLLYNASEKFLNRFAETESLIRQDGLDMTTLSINDLNKYWDEAKIKVNRNESLKDS
ncbi:MAG: nucleoside triphosphate pyrophosphohydrolase [Oscillospiraceae bacterium]